MAKYLEDKLSQAVEAGDSLAVDVARRELECEGSEHYKEYVVRYRLKWFSNAAVKGYVFAFEEEVRRFPFRCIESLKSLGSNRKMRDAFRDNFRDRFARCSDLLVQEFRSFLADFPHLQEAKAASCKGLVTVY